MTVNNHPLAGQPVMTAPMSRGLHHGQSARRGDIAAFTILELLVVVSLIVMLVALLLPALANGRGAARTAICASNLHQIQVAYRTRRSETAITNSRTELMPQNWPGELRRFVAKTGEVYKCPEGFHEAVGLGGESVPYIDITHGSRPAVAIACEPGPLVKVAEGAFGSDHYKLQFEYGEGSIDFNDTELIFDRVDGGWEITVYSLGRGPTQPSIAHEVTIYGPDGSVLADFPTNSMPGAVVTYSATGGDAISYGMNNVGHMMDVADGSKILMVDYGKIVADVVGPDRSDIWEDQMQPRHAGKMNVLFLDGSISINAPKEIDPTDVPLHDTLWEPQKEATP